MYRLYIQILRSKILADIVQDFQKLIMDLDIKFAMNNFTKKNYFDFMKGYIETNQDIYDSLLALLETDGWQDTFEEACQNYTDAVKLFISKKFFLNRKKYELDYLYALVCFVIPSIMEFKAQNPKVEEACKILVANYEKGFPSNKGIGIADKEELQSGFKTRIFGIPVGD